MALLKAGSAAWEIASAEAQVQQAEANLASAETALARTALDAPFDGAVTRVDVEVGNSVTPGEVVLVLAALDAMEVKTIDLTELDVARVEKGQPATVTVDALPDEPLSGRVTQVGLRDVDYRGDVTYPVVIELDEMHPEIRWGMTALVEIEVD
jgi:multidrug resistance efflux pump